MVTDDTTTPVVVLFRLLIDQVVVRRQIEWVKASCLSFLTVDSAIVNNRFGYLFQFADEKDA